jgi:outer membrane protein assembly factor BamB
VSGNNVTAINADTGQYLWNALTDGNVIGSPVAIENFVFVGSLGGDVVSYDVDYQGSAGSGQPAWLNAAKSTDKFVVGEISILSSSSMFYASSSFLISSNAAQRTFIDLVSSDGPVGTSLNRIESSTPAVHRPRAAAVCFGF